MNELVLGNIVIINLTGNTVNIRDMNGKNHEVKPCGNGKTLDILKVHKPVLKDTKASVNFFEPVMYPVASSEAVIAFLEKWHKENYGANSTLILLGTEDMAKTYRGKVVAGIATPVHTENTYYYNKFLCF